MPAPPLSPAPDEILALAFVDDLPAPTYFQFYTFDCYQGTSWVNPRPSGPLGTAAITGMAPALVASPGAFWLAYVDAGNNNCITVCYSTDLGATWSNPTVAQWAPGTLWDGAPL